MHEFFSTQFAGLLSMFRQSILAMNAPPIAILITGVFCATAMYDISRKYPRELYAIVYVFSVVFMLFLALNLAAEWSGKELKELLGRFAFAYEWLTNVEDELLLVGGVLYLGIGPQLMTYILLGPFGSASAPIFIRQIATTAILSLVKFLVGLGAVTLSEDLAHLLLGKAPHNGQLGLSSLIFAFFLAASYYLGYGWLATFYGRIGIALLHIVRWISPFKFNVEPDNLDFDPFGLKKINLARLRRMHKFCTRHSQVAALEPEISRTMPPAGISVSPHTG